MSVTDKTFNQLVSEIAEGKLCQSALVNCQTPQCICSFLTTTNENNTFTKVWSEEPNMAEDEQVR